MESPKKHISDLLAAFSGVLIFSALHEYIKLNGYSQYAIFILIFGVLLLIFSKQIYVFFKMDVLSKPLLLAISHSLIFIGTAVYLEKYLTIYLLPIFIVGVLILTYNDEIAAVFFKE